MGENGAEDLYIGTDANGDTVIGTGLGLLPWVELDELLAERYPADFPSSEHPPSVVRVEGVAA